MSKYELPERAEFQLPQWGKTFDKEFLLPCLAYFLFFRTASKLVKSVLWQDYEGFKQYRLHNISICFLHSLMSGGVALGFAITHPDLMFNHTMHWHNQWASHLLIFSIGYFIHDMIDMLQYEWSKWTLELLFHHCATIFTFSCALFSGKFLLYAYWALLMEVNSVFLHTRSIMQISGANTTNPECFRKVQWYNVISFVIFRFCVQAWQIWWIVANRDSVHSFYFGVGGLGGATFLVINTMLLYRILASDGFLGESFKKSLPNRDTQTFVKGISEEKKSS